MEKSVWKKLWTCRQTDCKMNGACYEQAMNDTITFLKHGNTLS